MGVADMRRTHQNLDRLQASSLDTDVTVYDLAQGFEASPRSRTERDFEEKVALVRASKTLTDRKTRPRGRPRAAAKARTS